MLVIDRCDTVGIATWQEIAARLRPAEGRLIDRYRSGLFRGERAASGRGYPTVETPSGSGRPIFGDVALTSIGRRSAWPETQAVFDVYWEGCPDRRVVAMRSIWPPDRWHDDEPPDIEFFDVHLVEGIHKHGRRWLRAQPGGPIVYMIWRNWADLDDPPAQGDPPDELISARAEIEAIQSNWITTD